MVQLWAVIASKAGKGFNNARSLILMINSCSESAKVFELSL